MSTTVRDASLVTQRNRNKAINAYATQFATAVTNSAAPLAGVTGPATTGAETVTQIGLGCTACLAYNTNTSNALGLSGTDPNIALYPDNRSRGGASSSTGTS
jgi:hypothetical protein